ncbi:MAG: ABC transporter ATP-binding protein [Candidatus Humimicrobiaceae bacterium]
MHRMVMFLGILYIFLTGMISLLAPWVLRNAIDSIQSETVANNLLKFSGFLVGIALMEGTFRFYMRKILIGVSRKIEYSLRLDLYAHMQTLDIFYFSGSQTGSIMALLTNDLDAVRNFLGPGVMNLFNTIFVFLSTLTVMFIINYKLTLYSLIAIPVLPFIVWKLSSILYNRSKNSQEQYANVSARTQESFAGIKVIKSFVQEQNEINDFSKINMEFVKRNLSLARVRSLFWPIMILIGGIGSVIVLFAGGRQVISSQISLGEFVQFSAYIVTLTWPLISLGWVINIIQRGGASMGRINEVFARQPVIKAPENAVKMEKISGNIKFKNIYFRYPQNARQAFMAFDSESSLKEGGLEISRPPVENISESAMDSDSGENRIADDESADASSDFETEEVAKNNLEKDEDHILKNISFVLKKGMTLGLTGLTGSGKTSLVNLILRLYDATSGKVMIDDINIKNISLELLRSSIGFVTQEPFLFSKSIRDNIVFGKEYVFENIPAREVDYKVADAARLAMLHEEIMGFPYGYETIIGERGVTLSGGQKQRLAIARALIVKPSILILDDSFSSVDTQTEEMILKALKEKTEGMTKIIISHRISTIKHSDLIIVMDDGQISETGIHKDLIKRTGIYKRLYLRQKLSTELEDELEEI